MTTLSKAGCALRVGLGTALVSALALVAGSAGAIDPPPPRPVGSYGRQEESNARSAGAGGEATFAVGQGPGWHPSRDDDAGATLQALALTQDEKRLLVAGSWSSYPFKGYVARLWN